MRPEDPSSGHCLHDGQPPLFPLQVETRQCFWGEVPPALPLSRGTRRVPCRCGVVRDICFQLELPFLAILFPSMENIFCSVFGGGLFNSLKVDR